MIPKVKITKNTLRFHNIQGMRTPKYIEKKNKPECMNPLKLVLEGVVIQSQLPLIIWLAPPSGHPTKQ